MKNTLITFAAVSFTVFIYFTVISSTDDSAPDRLAYDEQMLDKEDYYQKYINSNYKIFALPYVEELDFCGEKMPLSDWDVKERFDREMLTNTYWQSQTLLFQKRANRWFPVIEPILEKHGVPDDFKFLALIESGLQNVVSPAGASGYWQFLKQTGIEYGLEVNAVVDERYHVEKSTEAACKYLKDAYKRYNSWTLAAASYNMGMHGLDKQLKRQKSNNYYDLLLNLETSRYVFRIAAIKQILNNSSKYGFYFRPKDLYEPYRIKVITVTESINDLAVFAAQHKISYKTLKVLNPWLRDNHLPVKPGKSYEIKLPERLEDFGVHGTVGEEIEIELELEDSVE
jgi:membrane-bound lytic murein transglycosylase D